MMFKEWPFSNKYGSLKYKIRRFFNYKIPFISPKWYEWHFPLYHWWKARKCFKRPKAHFRAGKIMWFFGFPCRRDYLNPILDIRFESLGWKDKYDSPRHEWDPYISIVLFRKWQLLWIFNWCNPKDKYSSIRSMATWEAILDYLYYKKSKEQIIEEHVWGSSECEIYINPNCK